VLVLPRAGPHEGGDVKPPVAGPLPDQRGLAPQDPHPAADGLQAQAVFIQSLAASSSSRPAWGPRDAQPLGKPLRRVADGPQAIPGMGSQQGLAEGLLDLWGEVRAPKRFIWGWGPKEVHLGLGPQRGGGLTVVAVNRWAMASMPPWLGRWTTVRAQRWE